MPQFSIRFLLVLTAAVGIGVSTVRESREAAWAMNCLTVLFATGAIVAVVQSPGKMRTFWIGTTFPLALAAFWAIAEIMDPQQYHTHLPCWKVWCLAPINGLFAVALHWLFTPRPKP